MKHKALLMGALVATSMLLSVGAQAAVTEYTSQAAFDAAAPTASTFGFNSGGAISVLPNPSTFGGLSFFDETTSGDLATGGSPLLFLIDATDTPTYGVDFLSYQNTQPAIVADIDSAGSTAIGFEFGSYLPTGDATLTLSTGDSFTITPSSTPSFIGFTSTSPITSLSIDYPNSYAFDLISVSVAGVPEPASWAMMLVGFGGIGAVMRRSRRRLAASAA